MDLSLICFDIQSLIGQHVDDIRDAEKIKIKYDNVVIKMNSIFKHYLSVIDELQEEGFVEEGVVFWSFPEFYLTDEYEEGQDEEGHYQY